MNWLSKLFWKDDRTGMRSTSKLLRWLTFFLAAQFIIVCEFLIISKMIILTTEEIQLASMVKEFLIFFVGFSEGSYQWNRTAKMKHGSADLEKVEEIPQG
jgi:hypothetical protein